MFTLKTKAHSNPKLEQLIITNESLNFYALVLPNLGASIQEFRIAGHSILDGISIDEAGIIDYHTKFQSSLLFPFFGRIPQGYYQHDEKDFKLHCNGDQGKTAIHGHIYNQDFMLTSAQLDEKEAKIEFSYTDKGNTEGYPFPYTIKLVYAFSKNGVSMSFQVTNTGESSIPFGLGWHPYFKASDLDTCELSFNADSQLVLNAQLVPEGISNVTFELPLNIGNKELDHGFLLGKSAFILNTANYKATMRFSSELPYSYMQIYTPPSRKSIAIEPLTCAPNCLNNGLGLQLLEPKEDYVWNAELNIKIKKNH